HAELADEIRRHRPAHVVVEDVPAVEKWAQAVAANLDRRRVLCESDRWRDLVEVRLRHIVEVRGGARPDIADHRYFRGRGLIPLREWLAAGQQPFRRHAEAARVFSGFVPTVVAPAPRLPA